MTGSARLGTALGLVALLIGVALAPPGEAQRPSRPGRLAPPAEAGPGVISQQQRLDVTTPDGRVLVAAVARPRSNGPFPVVVVLHGSRELERALAQNSKTTFVWAHVGSGPAALARDLMRRDQNLHADLSTRNPIIRMGIPVEQNSMTDARGGLKAEWASLLREFPDRFMVGLDVNNPDRVRHVDELVAYYRAVLGQLAPATASNIAYRNAKRLLKIED